MREERTMKKLFMTFVLWMGIALSVVAQDAYLNEIQWTDCRLTKTADRQALLQMTVCLDHLDLNRQHSLRVVPVLVSADGSTEQALPSLVVEGTVRRRVQRRQERLGNAAPQAEAVAVVSRSNGTPQTVDYAAAVPFRRWMVGSSLQLRASVVGCAGCAEGDYETAVPNARLLPPMELNYRAPFLPPKEETVKRRSETRSARLQFRLDSYAIAPDFMGNRAELDSVHRSLAAVKDNPDLSVTGVYVTGYASPEGSYSYNLHLSERRAKSFAEYIRKDLQGIAPALVRVDWKGEDWEGVRDGVAKLSGLMKQQEVLNIIDRYTTDRDVCEEQLKALEPSGIYHRLLSEVYPDIRRNEYRIEYNVRHFTVDEGKQMLTTRPDLMSVSEIHQVADSYGKASPRYVDALLKGIEGHPEDVTLLNNVALALMEAGRTPEAVSLLQKAPREGCLLNLLGVAYARLGKDAQAEEAFRQAVAMEDASAADNLKQLQTYLEYMAE